MTVVMAMAQWVSWPETWPKPGSFNFGFVQLCVNGKTNPVLKRSGFVTYPEQFR